MKKKLFTVAFIAIFLLETILTMNVFGVAQSQSAVAGSDFNEYYESYFILPENPEILGIMTMSIIFVLLMICSFVNRIKILKVDENDVEKIKRLKAKIEIEYVVGLLGVIWCWMNLLSAVTRAPIIHN